MAFRGRFDAILFALGNRNYRIYTEGPDALGKLVSSVGIGAVLGGFWLTQWGHRPDPHRIAKYSNIGTSTHYLRVLDKFWYCGRCSFSYWICHDCGRNRRAYVDEQMRGRAVSLYGAISRGCPSVGFLVMGWIGDHGGLRWPIAGGAIICIALWAWIYRRRVAFANALETAP